MVHYLFMMSVEVKQYNSRDDDGSEKVATIESQGPTLCEFPLPRNSHQVR